MIEDYYKILNLSPNAGQVTLANHYLRLSNKYYALIIRNENYKEDFSRINRALEVLKSESVRKYYDILYNEKLKESLNPDNLTIQKYLEVINQSIFNGNQKAERLLNDHEYLSKSGIIQSPSVFWINFLFYVNPKLVNKYILLPILCLVYLVVGITIIIKQIENWNMFYLILGMIICLVSSAILYTNYFNYLVDKINNTFGNSTYAQ